MLLKNRLRANYTYEIYEIKNFGKFACPCPIKGSRFPLMMTETDLKTAVSAMPASAPTGRPSTRSLSSFVARVAPRFTARGDGRAQRPARASENFSTLSPPRRGDGDADRPPCPQHLDLFAIVKQIVDAKAQFRSLAEPWNDTATSTGRLMLAVLGGLADVERNLIRTRTAEGRSRAKTQGQQMGRKPKLTEAQQAEARRRRAEGARLPNSRAATTWARARFSRLTP